MSAAGEPRFERRPEHRPGELLEAALEVFADQGYRATRLEEIAARAGVSKATIYLYFRNKEDLLLQAVNHYLETLSRSTPATALSGESARSRLEAAMRKLWRAAQDSTWARVYRLVAGEIAMEHPEVLAAWAANGMVPVWDLMREIVEQGQRSGEFRADVDAGAAVRLLATGLIQQVYFESHTPLAEIAPTDLERLLTTALALALDGLRPSSPRAS